jgi:FKBP-type peptidyl-prolyl cis-trans isomerase
MRFKTVLVLAAFVLISGCGNKSMDGDGDGVPDSKDKCPNSPPGCQVDANGCEQPGETAQQPESQSTEAVQPPPTPVDAGIPQVAGDTVSTPSGLRYIDMKVGEGEVPQAGDLVQAHYTGWLTDGKKFDSSRDRGQAFMFPLGMGRVIKGWDEGIASMKVGGRRLLIIPSTLGYGANGAGGVIPPNATLIFDVELLGVQKPASGQ